jgi:NhaA family Na+:H+ antiporter
VPHRRLKRQITDQAGDLGDYLREETTGGQWLLAATVVALAWANLAESSYRDVWGAALAIGPGWLHLDLELADWVADGLLAVFFFVAGMEVKRELTVGELAERRAAALPVAAAAGGIVVPALVAIAVSGGDAANGGVWAIPVATDIAFALGVLALVGSGLPSGVRVVLLSMAVIDDLAAIAIIAVLFTAGLEPLWLLAAAVPFAAFWALLRARRGTGWVLWALAVLAWVCVHASGVHATVAGIVLGLLVPTRRTDGETTTTSERFEHRVHPISAGIVVPIFALSAAGIALSAAGGVISQPIALGVMAALLVGKPLGIFAGARLAVLLRLGSLPPEVRWGDLLPVAILGGIGYTVSLLIARLALPDPALQEQAAAAVLIASTIAAIVAAWLLRRRPSSEERNGPS